jgi:hypothetical protein
LQARTDGTGQTGRIPPCVLSENGWFLTIKAFGHTDVWAGGLGRDGISAERFVGPWDQTSMSLESRRTIARRAYPTLVQFVPSHAHRSLNE